MQRTNMKLLLLLWVFVLQAAAEKSLFQLCMGMEPAYCKSSLYDICKLSVGAGACPKICDGCPPIQPKLTKAVFSKFDCPKGKSQYENDKAVCWKAKWNNENGESWVIFYPNYVEIDGRREIVGYNGAIESDPEGSVFANGDVETGKNPVALSIISDLTNDSLLEVNFDSSRIPLLPNMFVSETPDLERFQLTGREANHQSDAGTVLRNFDTRAEPPVKSYKITVQPVMDKRFKEEHKANASKNALAIVTSAAKAFLHPSLGTNFEVSVSNPIEYNFVVKTSITGFVTTIGASGNKPFNYSGYGDVNIFIFMTKTPINEVGLDYRFMYAFNGLICGAKNTRFAVVDYFDSIMLATEFVIHAIGTLLGIKPDYLSDGTAIPKPRTAQNGEKCTKVGGFMDLGVGANKWTQCSVEDLKDSFDNGKLKCLEKILVQCPNDTSKLCGVMVRHIPNACNDLRVACPRSCSKIPACNAFVKNATIPPGGCMQLSCGNETKRPDNTTCPTCPTGTKFPPGEDCLMACPEMKRKLSCSQADVGKCCGSSCKPEAETSGDMDPIPNAGPNDDMYRGCRTITQMMCRYHLPSRQKCRATCRRLGVN